MFSHNCTWLTARDPPELICRDRGGEYASGARQGAPNAVQIADRFHLQRNSSQVLERVLHCYPLQWIEVQHAMHKVSRIVRDINPLSA